MPRFICEPLDHYGNIDLDNCDCWLCLDWRIMRRVARIRAAQFEHSHCKCINCQTLGSEKVIWRCLNYIPAQYDMLAASNRRDLWIELSYHTSFVPATFGEKIMTWLESRIRGSLQKRGWWAVHAERMAISRWLDDFEKETGTILPPAVDPAWSRKLTIHHV